MGIYESRILLHFCSFPICYWYRLAEMLDDALGDIMHNLFTIKFLSIQ